MAMRILLVPLVLTLAACGSQTPPPTSASATIPSKLPAAQHQHSNFVGMSANDLVEHFGTPRLQIRDGDGTKLQFATSACVLDAYLYPAPSGQGLPRVTYVDSYRRDGREMNAADCAGALEAR